MKAPVFSAKNNGTYRVPANIAPLRSAAGAADLRWIGIDLGRARGKRALLNAFARALAFPAAFGGNWDALADDLQDLSWLQGRGWVLALRGARDFAAAKADDHEVLQDIFGATAEHWQRHGRVFVVLSDAAGLPAYPG